MATKPRSGKTKTPSDTPMRVPAHGRGALRVGGTNKGGPGRPPSAIRELCRGAFAERIPILAKIADGEAVAKMKIDGVETQTLISADVGDRIKAIDQLAKYGLGAMKEVSVENVRDRVGQTLDVIYARCSAKQAAAIVAELRPIWA